MGYEGAVTGALAETTSPKFGERILKTLAEAMGELESVNSRLCKIESNMLPPIPSSPSSDKATPVSPSGLMDGIFMGISELRNCMKYTREMLSRLEKEL